MKDEFYDGREQTLIKHVILKRYLEKLAYKVGSWCKTINYVDGFAGPWKNQSEDLADTSPGIALSELRKVRDVLSREVQIRCLFIEKDPQAWRSLEDFLSAQRDIETRALNSSFETSIREVKKFCELPGTSKPFSFIFIDPTGWTGFPIDVIKPVLKIQPGEVLINFMTQHITRFIDADLGPAEKENFERLFGSLEAKEAWRSLSGIEREEEIVRSYCARVKEAGQFRFVVPTLILHPFKDRTHFHLIFATRHPEGLRTFRNDAEKPASEEQKKSRSRAWQNWQERSGQLRFFGLLTGGYLDELTDRYRQKMVEASEQRLKTEREVLFEDLELDALHWPFMNSWELKRWLKFEKDRGRVRYEGLGERERTPKPNQGHHVIWTG